MKKTFTQLRDAKRTVFLIPNMWSWVLCAQFSDFSILQFPNLQVQTAAAEYTGSLQNCR